jgi:hypothetical protein
MVVAPASPGRDVRLTDWKVWLVSTTPALVREATSKRMPSALASGWYTWTTCAKLPLVAIVCSIEVM